MAELGLAITVFVVTHVLAAVRPLRGFLVARLGERLYVGLFSLLSLALVIWLGVAYAAAPYIEIWPYVPAFRWLPVAVMPVACVAIVAGLSSPNPFSLGAGAKNFDALRPGIVAITRHPAIWGLALWSLAHIPINGDAAALLVFGLMTVLALSGPKSLDGKRRRAMGVDRWRRMAEQTRRTSIGRALVQIGWARLAAGLALYALLMALHEMVIGVSPWPV